MLNITAILIKLCALAGSNCNNCAFVGVTKVSDSDVYERHKHFLGHYCPDTNCVYRYIS